MWSSNDQTAGECETGPRLARHFSTGFLSLSLQYKYLYIKCIKFNETCNFGSVSNIRVSPHSLSVQYVMCTIVYNPTIVNWGVERERERESYTDREDEVQEECVSKRTRAHFSYLAVAWLGKEIQFILSLFWLGLVVWTFRYVNIPISALVEFKSRAECYSYVYVSFFPPLTKPPTWQTCDCHNIVTFAAVGICVCEIVVTTFHPLFPFSDDKMTAVIKWN